MSKLHPPAPRRETGRDYERQAIPIAKALIGLLAAANVAAAVLTLIAQG